MQKTLLNPISWNKDRVRIIDQTKLPSELKYEDCRNVGDVWRAIKKLKVRGAPLIGIAGALGFLLGVQKSKANNGARLLKEAKKLYHYLASSRPTAVNLFWALDLMLKVVEDHPDFPKDKILIFLKEKVDRIIHEDIQMCLQMSEYGSKLIRSGDCLLTVCNAGALATSGYGTALGVFYRAKEKGKKIRVVACETRPLLQGARLTTWELKHHGIDVTLICDNMAADLMRRKKINAVFVGADRIAANGDFANKIGTYSLAVSARYHKIPFYCVAPSSTLDLSLKTGVSIPIEQRDPGEVTALYFKKPISPPGIRVFNPAFDVTSSSLVTAIITEQGVIRKPFGKNLKALYGESIKRR